MDATTIPPAAINPQTLFNVDGLVALVTGGGTGEGATIHLSMLVDSETLLLT